jgi:hypothetical protein
MLGNVIVAMAAALSTCSSSSRALAFDKQTCATAYETAQQLRNELKLRRAREQLLVCGHSSCPAVVTKDCNAWLTQVDVGLASVVFRVRNDRGQILSDVRVSVDGELLREKLDDTAVMVDPGLHLFRFETKDFAPAEQRQMLPKGERGRPIEVRLQPRAADDSPAVTDAPRSDAPRDEAKPAERESTKAPEGGSGPGVGSYVAGGIGVLALSSFAYFGLTGDAEASHLRNTCAPNCTDGQVGAARSRLIAANVSLGVGIAAIGVGAVLWMVQASPPKTAAVSSWGASFAGITLLPSPGGAEVVTTFTAP